MPLTINLNKYQQDNKNVTKQILSHFYLPFKFLCSTQKPDYEVHRGFIHNFNPNTFNLMVK